MSFYTGHVPQSHQTEKFIFRPLTPDYTQLDYDALMSSKVILREWGGGTWPRDNFTLEENRQDLQEHLDEFVSGKGYAYTVLNPTETRTIGCFYTNALIDIFKRFNVDQAIQEQISPSDVLASFWIIEEHLAEENDLLQVIINWLKTEWEFERVYFATNERNDRQAILFRNAGMEKRFEWTHKDVLWSQYLLVPD